MVTNHRGGVLLPYHPPTLPPIQVPEPIAGPVSFEQQATATAATSPHPVTRGETPTDRGERSAVIAFLDWFAFTVRPRCPELEVVDWTHTQLEEFFNLPAMILEISASGRKFGYLHRIDLGGYGVLLFGGDSQRGTVHVELNSQGCSLVQDWVAVKAWGERFGATMTRVDLAHDDFLGRQINIDQARAWYETGEFSTNGRPPAHNIKGDWFTPGSPKGRTFYVGSREAGKYTRIYKKGKQLGDPL